MDTVNLFDAKNRLSALVDQVEEGREVTITRRGKPGARLVPTATQTQQGQKAAEKLRTLRLSISKRGEVLTWDELKSFRDEGRRRAVDRQDLTGIQISNPPIPVRGSKRSS